MPETFSDDLMDDFTDSFTGSFTQQQSIPEEGIEAAIAVLRHGRLHRYNVTADEAGETALLEEEFAAYTGAKYALAVASGGYAMGCALRALAVKPGDKVLSNGFTLAPVPGAIAAVGAVPVFVEITESLTICLTDLAAKIKTSGARVLLLSHMRGHLCDMDALMRLCTGAGVTVIEDCAHTMGASWRGTASGRHGAIGCYSCQTYKHINAGEGGLLVCDDAQIMARAILLSGSYMLYPRHRAAPPRAAFDQLKWDMPNVSGRMDNLRAAILRPQLHGLDAQVAAWNTRYAVIEDVLRNTPGLTLISRHPEGQFVGSSFQFRLADATAGEIEQFVAACSARGVDLKWFGAAEPHAFTSRYDSWRYAGAQHLPQTDTLLAGLMDMRLPLTFSCDDCRVIGRILRSEAMRLERRRLT